MSGANRLGPLVTMGNVRDACEALTREWIAPYLADAARAEGKAAEWIRQPRTYRVADEVMKWPEEKMPALIVAVPGTTGPPRHRSDGQYVATWAVTFGAIVYGQDEDDTDRQASIYEGGMREMFLQQAAALDGLDVERVTWTGSSNDPVPQQDRRYVVAASVNFDLELNDVVSARRALSAPPTPPLGDPGPYPTADIVTVDIQHIPEEA